MPHVHIFFLSYNPSSFLSSNTLIRKTYFSQSPLYQVYGNVITFRKFGQFLFLRNTKSSFHIFSANGTSSLMNEKNPFLQSKTPSQKNLFGAPANNDNNQKPNNNQSLFGNTTSLFGFDTKKGLFG